MKIVKPAKIPVLTRILELGRRPFLHVAGVVAFPLDAPRALCDELTFWKVTGEALGERAVFDEGFSRSRGELLVCGSFFAPEGKSIPASYVRARVGPVDKRLAVIGERTWQDGVPTPPVPMTTMPIDWAHAFGGASFDRNPYGKGAGPIQVDGQAVHLIPNVERYGALVRTPSDRPEPVGFLPMDVTFGQRRRRAGTYDNEWLEEHFPGMPLDTDPAFFNAAPEDQWINGFFQGDEEFLVENMHPDRPRIEGRLPGLAVRCFVTHRAPEGERFIEIPMRMDIVWLFPTAGLGAVVYHGSMRIAEDDAADIVHLVCACEESVGPRSVAHYQGALERRLDKDHQALAALSDTDLMPPRESGVIANLGGSDIGRWVRSDNLLAKNLRRGEERRFAEARARIESQGFDPKEYGLAELPPEPDAPPVDDHDALAAYMEGQRAGLEAARRELDAKEAEALQKARQAYADMGKDYDEVMAEAAKESAGPPKFSAAAHLARLHAMWEESRADGVPLEELERHLLDPTYRAQLEQQEQGMREMYRRFAHRGPAAVSMDPDASERVRILFQLAIESGERLANRDFTGADLAGMALAGVDLAGSFLEAADFSGANLSGANLEGAVLARANLRGANLAGARLRGANLGGAALDDAVLDDADVTEAVLSRASLTGARFTRTTLTGADWLETNLAAVDLSGAVLGRCNLLKADLRGARFVGSDLSEANLVECELDGADFSRATLHKTSFVRCKGDGTSFREARFRQGVMVHGSSFPRADFRDADMEKANLRGTVLDEARFDRANLDGADLSECGAADASFERALVRRGMMIRTNLTGASLRGANLTDALASKARLAGADFTGANLYRADVSRVLGDARTTFAEAEVGKVRFLPKADVRLRGSS
ncbi:DUF2169 domain-containing protein [Sorangium sp. So ce136]|uniref:DUF2169 domain-containing protein n=1 Tax=Sorangium sp. So ce136 TaxID=3133284 RepID=UPI003F069D52